jgi:hypothetical protein
VKSVVLPSGVETVGRAATMSRTIRWLDRKNKTSFFSPMKSAYELAMERLEKQSPSSKLTDEQRSQLAEIDSLYKSKMAERELLLADQMRQERAAGKFAEVEKLQQQLSSEIRRLTEECESKKESVRGSGA